jgi:hypothetical protein
MCSESLFILVKLERQGIIVTLCTAGFVLVCSLPAHLDHIAARVSNILYMVGELSEAAPESLPDPASLLDATAQVVADPQAKAAAEQIAKNQSGFFGPITTAFEAFLKVIGTCGTVSPELKPSTEFFPVYIFELMRVNLKRSPVCVEILCRSLTPDWMLCTCPTRMALLSS